MKNIFAIAVLLAVFLFSSCLDAQEADKKKNNEFDEAWEKLAKFEPDATEAVLFFAGRPDESVEYFKEHLLLLRLDEATFETILEELGSEDEEVAKKAREQFDYLDPRLFLGLEEIMDRVEEEPVRSRMVEALSNRDFGTLAGDEIRLRQTNGGGDEEPSFNFSSGNSSWWAEANVSKLGVVMWLQKPKWTRAVRAIKILEHIGSPESTRILARMAQGHKEAHPTIVARKIAMRIKSEAKEEASKQKE